MSLKYRKLLAQIALLFHYVKGKLVFLAQNETETNFLFHKIQRNGFSDKENFFGILFFSDTLEIQVETLYLLTFILHF